MTIWEVNSYNDNENVRYSLEINELLGVAIKQAPRLSFNEGKITKSFYKREINLMIEHFVQVTKSKSPFFNLTTFYNNLKTVSITILKNKNYHITHPLSPAALYFIKTNKIIIYDKSFLPVLYHELYHLCTRYINQDGIIYGGFSQRNPDGSKTGIGITEGYNALLTKRNFGKDDSYLIEQYFMSIVEYIIGKDLMEQFYSEMNLPALIDEIIKNDFIEEFVKASKSIDAVFEPINNEVQNHQQNKSTEYKNVYMAIIDMHIKIIKNKIKYGIINPKEAEEELSSLIANQNNIYRKSLWAQNIDNFITPEFMDYINNYLWSNMNFSRVR